MYPRIQNESNRGLISIIITLFYSAFRISAMMSIALEMSYEI